VHIAVPVLSPVLFMDLSIFIGGTGFLHEVVLVFWDICEATK